MIYFPTHLNIETSDSCNRSCSYCPVLRDRDSSPPRRLDLGVFERLLDELAEVPPVIAEKLKISLQWIDEPLIDDGFWAYAEQARRRVPSAQWYLQSNGDFLTAERAERLSPLFDRIVVNFYAERAWQSFARRGVSVNDDGREDLILHPGRLRPPKQGARAGQALWHFNQKWHDDDWVQDYDEVQVSAEVACHQLWVQAAVGYDGQVYICCRDNLKSHPVGDLHEMSLLEAYNSPEAALHRRRMEAGRRDRITMCHTCPGAFHKTFPALSDEEAEPLQRHRHKPGPLNSIDLLGARAVVDDSLRHPPAPTRASLAIVEHPAPPSVTPATFDPSFMPWGLYDYWTARRLARRLGHVVLPGFLPLRYEVVVGLLPAQAQAMVDVVVEEVGDRLKGFWVCGSRVMTRTHLEQVDPSVFVPFGTLEVGKKDRLRVLGADPRFSSDLDLKVLVDESLVDEDGARRLGHVLGERLEELAPGLPVSGHLRPLIRAWRVPSSCADARAAFAHYNAHRMSTMGKGPLSLEYTQLLFDPVAPRSGLSSDAVGPVRACLVEDDGGAHVTVDAPIVDEAFTRLETHGERLRASFAGLSGHQLIAVLEDFPELQPPGIVVEDGKVRRGGLAVWAAAQAGRPSVRAELRAR